MDAGCVRRSLSGETFLNHHSSFWLRPKWFMWNLQCRPDSDSLQSLINDKENEDVESKRSGDARSLKLCHLSLDSKDLFSVLLSSQPGPARLWKAHKPNISEIITYSHWLLTKGIFTEQIFVLWLQLFIILKYVCVDGRHFPIHQALLLKYENWNLKP